MSTANVLLGIVSVAVGIGDTGVPTTTPPPTGGNGTPAPPSPAAPQPTVSLDVMESEYFIHLINKDLSKLKPPA